MKRKEARLRTARRLQAIGLLLCAAASAAGIAALAQFDFWPDWSQIQVWWSAWWLIVLTGVLAVAAGVIGWGAHRLRDPRPGHVRQSATASSRRGWNWSQLTSV